MARAPAVGSLDQLVQIDARQESSSGGSVEITWAPEARVWARVEPLSAREFLAAGGMQAQATHRVTIRNRPTLTAKHRIRWNGKTLNIVGPLVPGTREPYLDLLCEEGVTDGT